MPPQPNALLQEAATRIAASRDTLLAKWRAQVRRLPTAQRLDSPTLDNHIPVLLDDLISALMGGHAESVLDLQLSNSPEIHGSQRLRSGFDIVEVVAEYNILREVIQSALDDHGSGLPSDGLRILNRIIDRAIAVAVDTFARERAIELQQRREEHLSFVIHDLRTPLSALSTARQVLERHLPPEARNSVVRHMLELQERNSQRLYALLTAATQDQYNIAATSNGMKAESREFDLWPLVEEVIRNIQPLAQEAEVRVVNHVAEDLTIVADARLLMHVFENLLSNALRYTKGGEIAIGAALESSQVRGWVRDTGEGIPAERLPKVFEKLETDRTSSGIGLGLTIVQQAIESHGGEVTVESTVGVGTTFTFAIPQPPRLPCDVAVL